MNELQLLAVNLTRRCNLGCAHCYLDADKLGRPATDELDTDEVIGLLDQVAELDAGTLIVLTGGEPLIRDDVETIARHGSDVGLPVVVGTNGMMLTRQRVESLKKAGVLGAGISLDSLDPDYHDRFRGCRGAWQRTLQGIENCREQDLSFQIHFTVVEETANELEAMVDFASASGARVLNLFFLVCTGRGESLSNISPATYEQLVQRMIAAQAKHPEIMIRTRCAPHFKRIAFENDPDASLNRISGRDGDGCIAGLRYCRVTPDGRVTPCPYMDESAGSIRSRSLVDIWQHSDCLNTLRDGHLKGRCGRCEYRLLCGGCRARPVAAGRDLMDEDDWCDYVPRGTATIVPLPVRASQPVRWSADAQARMERIPRFLRAMVRQRAEAFVADRGETLVTAEHLGEMAARRFGDKRPTRPPR